MKVKKVLIEPQYFPSVEYFGVLAQAEEVILEIEENFLKQTYRNRCHILTANGVLGLTVPVNKSSKMQFKDIRIDYGQKWMANHKAAVRAAYGKSPFFGHYFESLFTVFDKKHTFLLDLNANILSICLDLLDLELEVKFSEKFEKVPGSGITDLRSAIHPKKHSRDTLLYSQIPYIQVFGSKFVPNLSVIDLLFCEGPNAGYVIQGKVD